MPSKYRIKSDMMLEMEKIEPEIFQIKNTDEQSAEIEEEPKLTRAEMIERSRELRQLRLREAQKSIKARHQNKIKSKKYHRILKKEKMRQQIKEFELLQKTDPEAALRKLEQLDRSRVEERANLRHRNTGTWAKNLQVRAKYDKDVRKDLADQIAISRELTAKKPIDESSDEEAETNVSGNDLGYDPFNPWLKSGGSANGAATADSVNDFVSGYRKYWQERNQSQQNLKAYRNSGAENETEEPKIDLFVDVPEPKAKLGKSSKKLVNKTLYSSKTKGNIKKISKLNAGWIEEDITTDQNVTSTKGTTKKSKKQKKAKLVDNLDDLFDEAEEEMRDKFKQKYKSINSELSGLKTQKVQSNDDDGSDVENKSQQFDLSFKSQNKRPKLDEELNGGGDGDDNLLQSRISNTLNAIKSQNQPKTMSDTENINPDDIANVKSQHLQTAIPDTIYGNEDDGFIDYNEDEYHFDADKKLTIAEAFQDDDIVAEFNREKDDEEKKNAPQEIDLSLPGWGSWGGTGINSKNQKTKRKLILRFPAAEKRRVDNQGNLIIIENRDEQMQKHLVTNLPFPFTSVADYEQSIRQPIGKDFVAATAHRVLIKPAVTTKSGTIIEPMNEQSLVKRRKTPATKTERQIAKIVDDDEY